MKVDEFDFDLPRERIADRPARPRDASRLLVVRPGGLEDRAMGDLPRLLAPGDLLVLNDTKVIPARLRGSRGRASIEVTLTEPLGGGSWRALAKPARKLRAGDRIEFASRFVAEVVARGEAGFVTLSFGLAEDRLFAELDRHGTMPLPPYIRRADGADAADRVDYQTVYAARPGAVAAPTAGLHFTPELLAALAARGIGTVTVTLHVGAGTFLPVTAAETSAHVMHAERGEISEAAAARVNAARKSGGRVVAVGTTALRLLETAVRDGSVIAPFAGSTDLFILPGYRFKAVDLLLTNFHLPRSTLFMLVCAFAGIARMKSAYAHALAAGYRFYSYGDASLLEPAEAA